MARENMDQYSTLFPEEAAPPGEIGEPRSSAGSYILGFAGALLGAVIGVIPWFLASTFANFFVGWLGFLVGVAACWGYRKCRGARRTGYAMTVIVICSVLALVLAEFASWMYILCTDPGWQADAAWYGIPVARLAFESLLMPENWPHILPGLLMGLFIGILGIISARRKVLEYTDPERTAQVPAPAYQRTAGQTMPVTTGLQLPYSFTLQTKPSTRKLGRVCFAMAAVFFLLFMGIAVASRSMEILPISCFLCLILLAEGILLLRFNKNYRLEIEGERLRFVSRMGKVREFTAGDIANVSVSNTYTRTLYDHSGKVLAKVNQNMENLALLTQYLSEHNIPLRG